ncbi:glycosyltransferase family 39 protein [Candidatus Woesearchaeota archaeon]|nr:glycosyltransferase family 39 protein [Candidatus Woesearchaeota archaeon]
MPLKDCKGIIAIILFFIAANILFLGFYNDVWWDSAVYIGMGKHIYSLGKAGLWEESRPLALPLILGIGWKLGFEPVYFGRAISMIFSALTIFLTYKIGLKLFSRKEALLAAFFTAFSFTFFFFSPNILTEIPSTLFILLAFYFYLEKRFFITGIFAGIAVMTRLFQIFMLAGLGIAFVSYFWNKPRFGRNLAYIAAGASIFIIPYLLLSQILYGDIILPFKVQSHLTQTTGWALYGDYGFYFAGLLKENFFLMFLLTLPLFFRRNYKLDALLLMPLMYLLIFSFAKHKEMRFMILIFPFLYMLLSYTLIQIYNGVNHKKAALAVFIAMAAVWAGMTFSMAKNAVDYSIQKDGSALAHFQDYMKGAAGNVWITSPLYALHSDKKPDGLLYFFSSGNLINFIAENENKVDAVLYSSCDMECPPEEIDSECGKSRKVLLNMLLRLKKIYENEIGQCRYAIYRKII